MRIIGLTGSIGMGKTTTAAMFRARGVPVHDADRTVHRLYAGPAVAEIEQVFPGTTEDGAVDRGRLAEHVTGRPDALRRLEAIVHPMVREVEAEFLRRARQESRRAVVLDVPLLLETESVGRVDTIVVVSADMEIQRERVLSRPGMTEDKFEALLARQLPDQEKRRRAHFVIDTGRGLDHADRQVEHLLRALAFAT